MSTHSAEDMYTDAMNSLREAKNGRAHVVLTNIAVCFPGSRWAEYAMAELKKLEHKPSLKKALESIEAQAEAVGRLEAEWTVDNRRTWEYKNCDDPDNGELSTLGASGWELVGVVSFQTGGGLTINGIGGASYTVHTRYAFKREIGNSKSIQNARGALEALKSAFFST